MLNKIGFFYSFRFFSLFFCLKIVGKTFELTVGNVNCFFPKRLYGHLVDYRLVVHRSLEVYDQQCKPVIEEEGKINVTKSLYFIRDRKYKKRSPYNQFLCLLSHFQGVKIIDKWITEGKGKRKYILKKNS